MDNQNTMLNLKTKRGDIIEADCGYNGMIDERECKVLEKPYESNGLFPNSPKTLNARVEILGTGEVFTTSIEL
jgi:hypothetical protein